MPRKNPKGERYQGWANYETWAISLWIDNEEGSYRHWQAQAQEAAEDNEVQSEAVSDLARKLKDEHEEAMPQVDGVWGDLLGAALSEVDWYEIAEHMIDEVWDAAHSDEDDDDEEEEDDDE